MNSSQMSIKYSRSSTPPFPLSVGAHTNVRVRRCCDRMPNARGGSSLLNKALSLSLSLIPEGCARERRWFVLESVRDRVDFCLDNFRLRVTGAKPLCSPLVLCALVEDEGAPRARSTAGTKYTSNATERRGAAFQPSDLALCHYDRRRHRALCAAVTRRDRRGRC